MKKKEDVLEKVDNDTLVIYKDLIVLMGNYNKKFPGSPYENIFRGMVKVGIKAMPSDDLALKILDKIVHCSDSEPLKLQTLSSQNFDNLTMDIRPIYYVDEQEKVASWCVDGKVFNKVISLIDYEGVRTKAGFWCDEKGEKVKLVEFLYITESDTKDIKTRHPGVLKIPEGKHFYSMPLSHYIDLAKSVGKPEVMKALLNLERWNKNKNSDISSKARTLIDKLKDNKEWIGLSESVGVEKNWKIREVIKEYSETYENKELSKKDIYRILSNFLEEVSKKVKFCIAEESINEADDDTLKIVARGIVDKDTADKIASDKKGKVVVDNKDEKKFMVVVSEGYKANEYDDEEGEGWQSYGKVPHDLSHEGKMFLREGDNAVISPYIERDGSISIGVFSYEPREFKGPMSVTVHYDSVKEARNNGWDV